MVVAMAVKRHYLDRATLCELYAESERAERVLHAALDAPEVVRENYWNRDQGTILSLLGRLNDAATESRVPTDRSKVSTTPPRNNALISAFRRIAGAIGGRWSLSDDQARFMGETFRLLLDAVRGDGALDREFAIRLRMRFYGCHWMIRRICGRAVASVAPHGPVGRLRPKPVSIRS